MHDLDHRPRDEERALEIDGQDLVPHGLGQAVEIRVLDEVRGPGVVDQHVDPAQLGHAPIHHLVDRGVVGDRGLMHQRLDPDLAGQLGRLMGLGLGTRIVHRHVVASPSKAQHGRPTDPRRRPRNQRNP